MKQEKLPDCLSEYQWNNARSEWERRKSSSAIAVSIFLQIKKSLQKMKRINGKLWFGIV